MSAYDPSYQRSDLRRTPPYNSRIHYRPTTQERILEEVIKLRKEVTKIREEMKR